MPETGPGGTDRRRRRRARNGVAVGTLGARRRRLALPFAVLPCAFLLCAFLLAVLALQAARAWAADAPGPYGATADVEVTLAGPGAAAAGQAVSYAVTATNLGPGTAVNETVRDFPGTGVTVTAMTYGGAACPLAPVPACTIPEIPAGGAATVAVSATVAANAPNPVYDTVTATNPADPDADGGCATVTTLDGCADRAEARTAVAPLADVTVATTGPITADAGSGLTYTVTARNDGPADAGGEVIREFAGAGLTVTGLAITSGHGGTCTAPPGPPSCTVNAIPAGQAAVIEVSARVDDGATGELTHRVTASNPYDPDGAAGCADAATLQACADRGEWTTGAVPVADVDLLQAGPAPVTLPPTGPATVTYTVIARNNGPSTATGEVVREFPGDGLTVAGLSIDGGHTGMCAPTPAPARCTIDAIRSGEAAAVTVIVNVAPDTAGLATNTVTNTATATNPADRDPDSGCAAGPADCADASSTTTPVRPRVSVGDVTVAEGGPGATVEAGVPVTLSAPPLPGETVTVHYATADGTASTAVDAAATSGTLTFTGAETSKVVPVPVIGDAVDEPDETLAVRLDSPSNASIADGEGIATIADDDRDGTLSCRATALRLGPPDPAGPADAGAGQPDPCADARQDLPALAPGPDRGVTASSGPVWSATDQTPDDPASAAPQVGDVALAQAHLDHLDAAIGVVPGPSGDPLTTITAGLLESTLTARCDPVGSAPTLTGSARIADVRVGDQVIVDADGKVRKALNVSGSLDDDGMVTVTILGIGKLYLNQHANDPGSGVAITRALRLEVDRIALPDVGDVTVAETTLGYRGNPCTG